MAILGLLHIKTRVKQTPLYRKLNGAKKNNRARGATFADFLLSLRSEDLFRLTKEVGLLDENNLPTQVASVLYNRGYDGRLVDFVRKSRNCIHPRSILDVNKKFATKFNAYIAPEGLESFHADFALCAWTLHGRLYNGLKSIGLGG